MKDGKSRHRENASNGFNFVDTARADTPEGCFERELFLAMATGKLSRQQADHLLSHAATCPVCGPRLASSMKALEGNPSPEEAAAIAELVARKEWQREMAASLAATGTAKPGAKLQVFRPDRRWLAGGAIAASVLAVSLAVLWQGHTSTAEYQLATAYTASRTLELRIPDAKYSSLKGSRHTRGAVVNHEPPALLEAQAHLARELEQSPQNAHWLALQARADLLEERYDVAIDSLDRLISAGPATPELLADDAAAYYQRGLVSGSEADRSTALDYLRRADSMTPTDPVILFNEAIVMEDRGQMMNAVEVWNRYVAVERDPAWAAEGSRKLAALEQTLNRYKSHQSRIDQMLQTPEAMDALARDPERLGRLDEELTSYDLEPMFAAAYPVVAEHLSDRTKAVGAVDSQQARGSPCDLHCVAARKLLKSIADSLETRHQDYWLTDLLSPDIDSLPASAASTYARAMQSLGKAMQIEVLGSPAAAKELAGRAQDFFSDLGKMANKDGPGPASALRKAAVAGEQRAAVEYLFSLQREGDNRGCREESHQLDNRFQTDRAGGRFPSIATIYRLVKVMCFDTPDTRAEGGRMLAEAGEVARAHDYRLLTLRAQAGQVTQQQNAGDVEAAERLAISTIQELNRDDSTPIRMAASVDLFPYIEENAGRPYARELYLREAVDWFHLVNSPVEANARRELARSEIRIGAMDQAKEQFKVAHAQGQPDANFIESDILLANSYLERGDLQAAEHSLDEASRSMSNYSDAWGLRAYAAARGQLELTRGHLDQAEATLTAEIVRSEGSNARGGDKVRTAEYARLDHDLYAELAATWLKQGRKPESVLALWERFQLQSRGLPVTPCNGSALDCDLPALVAAQGKLGSMMVVGQVVMLDRVLVYTMDEHAVHWTKKACPRQEILDAAQRLELAVSSPLTKPETAADLGRNLSDRLLPEFQEPNHRAAILVESDPMLANLPWAVLPTRFGTLGLEYPLAELRSILAEDGEQSQPAANGGFSKGGQQLVVGASSVAGGSEPLPEALEEAEAVDRFLISPQLLVGERATSSNIARSLSSASVFHFAGHAVPSDGGTRLLLAASTPGEKSPWLDGAFLRKHPPRACRLAVLSACATGSHDASWIHPLEDMVETLSSFGVPEVVATKWQIDSQAAVPFMHAFYTNLGKGSTVAMALTEARKLQSRQSVYKNPYYWGAYYVSGRETTYFTRELHASR